MGSIALNLRLIEQTAVWILLPSKLLASPSLLMLAYRHHFVGVERTSLGNQ